MQGQMMPMGQYPQQQMYAQPQMQYPQQFQQGLNMGSVPAVYAAPLPSAAQMYSSGVPGAPPTIAIPTDDMSMQQFGNQQFQGPRPQRGITLKRRSNQSFGSAEGSSQPSVDSNTRINVIKGS
jgi:hypothetical protein